MPATDGLMHASMAGPRHCGERPCALDALQAALQVAGGEQLPYPAAVLQERLAGGSAAELEAMQAALEARARALISSLVAQAAPESEYPGAAGPRPCAGRTPCKATSVSHTKCMPCV